MDPVCKIVLLVNLYQLFPVMYQVYECGIGIIHIFYGESEPLCFI